MIKSMPKIFLCLIIGTQIHAFPSQESALAQLSTAKEIKKKEGEIWAKWWEITPKGLDITPVDPSWQEGPVYSQHTVAIVFMLVIYEPNPKSKEPAWSGCYSRINLLTGREQKYEYFEGYSLEKKDHLSDLYELLIRENNSRNNHKNFKPSTRYEKYTSPH